MQYKATSPKDYLNQVPKERKEPLEKLRRTIKKNLPKMLILLKELPLFYGILSTFPKTSTVLLIAQPPEQNNVHSRM